MSAFMAKFIATSVTPKSTHFINSFFVSTDSSTFGVVSVVVIWLMVREMRKLKEETNRQIRHKTAMPRLNLNDMNIKKPPPIQLMERGT